MARPLRLVIALTALVLPVAARGQDDRPPATLGGAFGHGSNRLPAESHGRWVHQRCEEVDGASGNVDLSSFACASLDVALVTVPTVMTAPKKPDQLGPSGAGMAVAGRF